MRVLSVGRNPKLIRGSCHSDQRTLSDPTRAIAPHPLPAYAGQRVRISFFFFC